MGHTQEQGCSEGINSFLNGLLSADFSPLEDRIDFGGHELVDAALTTSLNGMDYN